MKISANKCKFDAKYFFLELTNFVLTTFLHHPFSMEISSSNKLKDDSSKENGGCKKVVKKKIASSKKMISHQIYTFTMKFSWDIYSSNFF